MHALTHLIIYSSAISRESSILNGHANQLTGVKNYCSLAKNAQLVAVKMKIAPEWTNKTRAKVARFLNRNNARACMG